MSNRRDNQFTWNPHNRATILDCSFTVAAADTGGLGITGLKASGRIASVYMHTSQTPAALNPNPASGVIVVNFQDNYNSMLCQLAGLQVPTSGSALKIDNSALTIGSPYVISTLGDSTAALWQSVGVPANITAAAGVGFIATAVGSTGELNTSTSRVMLPKTTGAGVFSVAALAAAQNANGAYTLGGGQGMQMILGCYADTAADTPLLAAPADGTVISLMFYLNNSAQGV